MQNLKQGGVVATHGKQRQPNHDFNGRNLSGPQTKLRCVQRRAAQQYPWVFGRNGFGVWFVKLVGQTGRGVLDAALGVSHLGLECKLDAAFVGD